MTTYDHARGIAEVFIPYTEPQKRDMLTRAILVLVGSAQAWHPLELHQGAGVSIHRCCCRGCCAGKRWRSLAAWLLTKLRWREYD